MCFSTYDPHSGKDATRKRATKDIICYKVVYLPSPKIATSKYEKFEYKFGEVYKLGERITPIAGTVNRGFHSYSDEETAFKNAQEMNLRVVECIISKGTTYLINPYRREIVSESIIINKTKRRNRYVQSSNR